MHKLLNSFVINKYSRNFPKPNITVPLYNRNDFIKAPTLFVIDENEEKLGEMSREAALELANEKGLDLIEVAPNLNPPVAKIYSWSKFKYKLVKKKKEAGKNKMVSQKEMWFNSFIGQGDLDHKIERTVEFLQKKHTVKLTIRAKGRVSPAIMRDMLNKIISMLGDKIEEVKDPPKFEGRNLTLLVRPIKHKKVNLISENSEENHEEQNTQSNPKTI